MFKYKWLLKVSLRNGQTLQLLHVSNEDDTNIKARNTIFKTGSALNEHYFFVGLSLDEKSEIGIRIADVSHYEISTYDC